VIDSLPGRLMLAALGVVLAATVIGLVEYWPPSQSLRRPDAITRLKTEGAVVKKIEAVPCRTPGRSECERVTFELTSGPDDGERASFTVGEGTATIDFDVGDKIRVLPNHLPESAQIDGVRVEPYSFSDFDRLSPLVWLAAVFGAVVLITGRWQGLRALIGLAASLAIIVSFIVPSILHGRSPEAVALFGCLAVMLITIPLAHGWGAKSVAACLGTAASLLLTLGLANLFVDLAHLTGFGSEEAIFLRSIQADVSVQGLLLAGMLIGALGVLDDVTVSQASTVLALRRANPALGFAELFRSALRVGHDHIAATVNTLVLAYAGASLPVLLIFSISGTSFSDAVNSEAVAAEIVAMLVGSIGLIAAVPITTALAALLAPHAYKEAVHAHGQAHA
jgi:uncharacterized membrane protein